MPSWNSYICLMSKNFHYFAYGSDMSLPQMRGRLLNAEIQLEDDARQSARLNGFQLVFNRPVPAHAQVGHANLREAQGMVCEGVLYHLPAAALSVLDQFEGVAQGRAKRLEVEVESAGEKVKAYVYVASPGSELEGLKPSRNHLYRLLSASRYLSPDYFKALKATDSLKIAVDDDGMPHGVQKKLKQIQTEAALKNPVSAPPPQAKPSKTPRTGNKEKKALEAETPEKKKFYPPVGAYAPKSARAFRKAYGIAPKETDSPWGGRSSQSGSKPTPKRDNPWADRGSSKGGKKPGKGRPW